MPHDIERQPGFPGRPAQAAAGNQVVKPRLALELDEGGRQVRAARGFESGLQKPKHILCTDKRYRVGGYGEFGQARRVDTPRLAAKPVLPYPANRVGGGDRTRPLTRPVPATRQTPADAPQNKPDRRTTIRGRRRIDLVQPRARQQPNRVNWLCAPSLVHRAPCLTWPGRADLQGSLRPWSWGCMGQNVHVMFLLPLPMRVNRHTRSDTGCTPDLPFRKRRQSPPPHRLEYQVGKARQPPKRHAAPHLPRRAARPSNGHQTGGRIRLALAHCDRSHKDQA